MEELIYNIVKELKAKMFANTQLINQSTVSVKGDGWDFLTLNLEP